jgi:hypothetical protein
VINREDLEERTAIMLDGNPGMSEAEATRLATLDTAKQPALNQMRAASRWTLAPPSNFTARAQAQQIKPVHTGSERRIVGAYYGR